MVPLKPTTKESQSRSHSITNRAPSTSSSKRYVESASFTNNYLDNLDDETLEKQLVGIAAINVVHTIQISTPIGDLGVMLLEKNQKIHQRVYDTLLYVCVSKDDV